MEIYNYHYETREFIAPSKALPNPMEPGRYLIPAHATTMRPPVCKAQEAAIFNGSDWQIVPDWRNTTYWLADGSEHAITTLGETLPEGALLEQPVTPQTTEEALSLLAGAVSRLLDETAESRGYDNAVTLCSYDDSGNPSYDAEAKVFKHWRNAVWEAFFAVHNAVTNSERSLPEEDALINTLPAISWPD